MARPNLGTVKDNFDRADGAPGANWSTDPLHAGGAAFRVLTNNFIVTAGAGGYSEAWWNVSSFTNTGAIGVGATVAGTLIPKAAANSFSGYYLDLVQQPSASLSTADGYQCAFRTRTGTDTLTIWKYTNASLDATVPTLLAETNLAADMAVNDTIDMTVGTDGTINVYHNGTVIATVQDVTAPIYFGSGQAAFAGLSSIDPINEAGGFNDFFAGLVGGGNPALAYDQDKTRRAGQAVRRAAFFMLGDKWERHGKTSLLVPPRLTLARA